MSDSRFRHIPILLTGLRALLGPGVIACAYLRPDATLLVSCVVVAFLSDVFDGMVARRLGIATASLRRLDSIADSIFYLCALWAVWVLHPRIIVANSGPLVVLAALEAARYWLDVHKFGREASYHMWSTLRSWRHDVPSIFHALRIRAT